MARRGRRGYPRSMIATSHFAKRPSLGDHLKVRLPIQ
jgi:hypothetical protein